MQIKTTMKYHITSVRMAIIKRSINNHAVQGVEKREPSYAVGGNISWCGHYGKQYGGGLVVNSCLTLVTPWTVAGQAPLSMGFSGQEYWSGLPFPSLLNRV